MRTHSLVLVTAVAGILGISTMSLAYANPGTSAPANAERDPRRISLLIGIADYEHFGAAPTPEMPLADLRGPENDVKRLQVSLNRWGFGAAEDTRVLLGPAATRDGIGAGFRWLAERAVEPGDAVVIYFSGHGSHAPDGADKDEPDGRDEALVPYDARDAHDPAQLVIDDQIREYLKALGTENVTIVIDACYSGTVTRGNGDAVGRDKGPKPFFSEMPDAAGSTDFTEARGHTLITAARSDQTAQELPYDEDGHRVWLGAMTYHLTRALDGAVATRGLRYDSLMTRLTADVRGALLPQVPQLEGDRGALLFRSNQGIAERPFINVASATGSRVTLDAGAIHGIRASAVYDIHNAGTVRFDARPMARVRVDSVVEERAFAHYIDDRGAVPASGFAPPRLPANARAVLTLLPLGAQEVQRLAVHFDASAAPLAAAFRADTLRFRITDSASAFATVTRMRGVPEVLVRGISLPPQEGDSTVRNDATIGYRPDFLCKPLIRALSIAAMEGVENPAPPAELTVDVRFTPAGSSAPTGVREAGATDLLRIGNRYDIWVRADVPADRAELTRLYLTAAVVGYASDPFVLAPRGNATQTPIQLNTWVRIWQGMPVGEPAGSEIVKVVVSSDQYDFRSLARSFGTCSQPRMEAGGTRGLGDDDTTAPVTGWTAVSHRIDIRGDSLKK